MVLPSPSGFPSRWPTPKYARQGRQLPKPGRVAAGDKTRSEQEQWAAGFDVGSYLCYN